MRTEQSKPGVATVSEGNFFSFLSGNHPLYHWQEFVKQAEPNLRAIKAALQKCDPLLTVLPAEIPGVYRVQWITPASNGEQKLIIGSFRL